MNKDIRQIFHPFNKNNKKMSLVYCSPAIVVLLYNFKEYIKKKYSFQLSFGTSVDIPFYNFKQLLADFLHYTD